MSPKLIRFFEVTDEDETKVNQAIRKNLVPRAIDHVNKILAKESKRVIGEGRSRILRIEAIDLNGDGKKGFHWYLPFQGKYSG